MHYYQVIPLINIASRGKVFFTYKSRKKIPAGSLAAIEFGKRKIQGVIFKKTGKPAYPVKNMAEVKFKKLLNPKQLALAKEISRYYLCPLGISLKLFVPKITKKKLPTGKNILPGKDDKKPVLTFAQREALEKISKKKDGEFLLQGPASSGKTEVLMGVIEKNIQTGGQALVIIPEIFLSYQEIYRYQQRFGAGKTVLLHSQLKDSEFSNTWKKIEKGTAQVIIATKAGLFCNFKKLKIIALDEEQDISHKQWGQNPRYHSKQVAQWMKKIHQAKVIYLSATPGMETIKQFQGKTFEKNKASLPMLKTEKLTVKLPRIEIEDLKKYYQKFKNNMVLSKDFLQNLSQNIKEKKLAFVAAAQRGKNCYTICRNCNQVIKCPRCQVRLVEIGDEFRCIHCNYKINNLSSCPNCKSLNLENVGFGTEKIEQELRKKFPQAKIKKLDQSVFKKRTAREKIYQLIKDKKIDILVGTSVIAKGFDFPQLQLAAVLNADHFAATIDFRANERQLGGLFQLAGRLNRPGSGNQGKMFIQTFEPENKILEYLKNWDWQKFAQQELKQRKTLKYPPYSKLIKLTYKNQKPDLVEKNVQTVYNNLLRSKTRQIIEIFPPYFGFIKREGIIWKKHILIKAAPNFNHASSSLFQNLKPGWMIDIDPLNVF